MKKQNKFIKAVVVLLLFATVFLLLSTVSFADDYSKPGTANKETLDSSAVLSEIFDVDLTDIEKEYLSLYGEYDIIYTPTVPSNVVQVKRSEIDGLFYVIAKPYSYTAANGKTVCFIPTSVKVREEVYQITEQADGYIATFQDAQYTESESAVVTYKTYIELEPDVANELLIKTYRDAVLFSEYKESYDAFQKYLVDFSAFSDYLADKALYDRADKAYNDYLADKAQYELDLKNYGDYLVAVEEYNTAYLAYIEDQYIIENYSDLYAKYQEYSERIKKVKSQLEILDGLNKKTFNRSVYNAVIIGTTVTAVLTNKELIANEVVGASRQDVDNAGIATDNLRSLCKPYFELKGEMEKYCYYILYYEEIRDNFTTLWISLDNLYKNAKVRTAIANMDGMREKFEILLGQLCYVTMALNGGPVGDYSPNYVINQRAGTTVLSVLGGDPYLSYDVDPTPLSSYPEEVGEPIIQNIPEPVRPREVKEPVEPDEVFKPGDAPEVVDEPTPVSDPGRPPKNYETSPMTEALISAYRSGELVKREEIKVGARFEIEATVTKNILGAVSEHRVVFYDESGAELYRVTVDEGSYVDYDGVLPTKAETAGASYTFVGWQDKDGNVCDTTSVTESLELYPIFKETVKNYTVGWIVDGKSAYVSVPYGEIPICPLELTKEDSENYEYEFVGWNIPVTEVRSSVTYVAEFSSSPLCKNGEVTRSEEGFLVQSNSNDLTYILDKLITRVKKNEVIAVKGSNFSFELSPENIAVMKEEGCVGVTLNVVRIQSGGYKIVVSMVSSDGKVVDLSKRAEPVKISLKRKIFNEGDNVTFFYLDAQASRVAVRSQYTAGVLSADCEVGRTYYALVEHPAYVFPSTNVELSVKTETPGSIYAQKGEIVTITVSSKLDGVDVDAVYFVDANNRRYDIEMDVDGAYRFEMIEGGVTVGVDSHLRSYKLTFMVGDTVFSEQYVTHGSLAPMLSAAKKSDEDFTYTFSGWSVEGKIGVVDLTKMPVTSDITLTAVFTPVKIVHVPIDQWRTPAKIFLIAFYAVAVLIPVIFLIAIKAIARSRRRA